MSLGESRSLSGICRYSISGKIGLFAANSVSVSFSGKFEQLYSPSFVSDFKENSFNLCNIHSLSASNGHSVT